MPLQNFVTHGSVVRSRARPPAPMPVNEDRELRDILICASIEQNPTQSTKQMLEIWDLGDYQKFYFHF